MLFEFTADQRLWRDTVRDVLAKECPATLVRSVADQGADPAPLWKVYNDLGWTELTDPETAIELAIVLDELGHATDPTPFLATTTQFAPLAPGVAQAGQSGTAVYEGVSARRDGDDWILDGTARYVLDGDRADWLAVVTGEGVFTVPATETSAERVPVFDPLLHVAEVTFPRVRVHSGTGADPVSARQLALTGMALTMVGACRRVLELTLEHVRTRHQFGSPLGSFQAVKHKAADMRVAIERASALAYFAALTIAENDPRRRIAATMAKAAAGECQSVVYRNGIQLFGAMGMTWDNELQFGLKRAKAGELLLGGAVEHRAVIAEECHAIEL